MIYDLEEQRKFKVGDKVRVIRKARSFENNWNNSWNGTMDKAINEIGIITRDVGMQGLSIKFGVDSDIYNTDCNQEYQFPYFVLEKVGCETEVPVATQSMDEFPHVCEYCGSPCWNGMEFRCSNANCVTKRN